LKPSYVRKVADSLDNAEETREPALAWADAKLLAKPLERRFLFVGAEELHCADRGAGVQLG
jgi:hypothetical protein